jgi:hypothetical protein
MHYRESLWISSITKSEEYHVSDSLSVRRTLIRSPKETRYSDYRYLKRFHMISRGNHEKIAKASMASIADLSCEEVSRFAIYKPDGFVLSPLCRSRMIYPIHSTTDHLPER